MSGTPSQNCVVTIAMILAALVFTWVGWTTYTAYYFAETIRANYLHLEEVRGTIIHLDEVLTTSARMAAATGDPRWEARYRFYKPQLGAAIKQAAQLAPQDDAVEIAQTDAANVALVAFENQAFAFVRAGQLESAQAVLFSPAYEAQKQVYSTGISAFIATQHGHLDMALRAARNRTWLAIVLAVVGYVVVLASCVRLLALLAGERSALRQTRTRLKQRNEQLAHTLLTWNALRLNLDLTSLLHDIVQAAHSSLGFQTVVLNLVEPDRQRVRVRAHAGLDAAGQQALTDAVYEWDAIATLLQEPFRAGQCYFIPQGVLNWSRDFSGPTYLDETRQATATGMATRAWHPQDALLVPIELRHGQIAGFISVDHPEDGQRPSAETLQALDIFGSQAAIAIESAQIHGQLQQELAERTRALALLANPKDAADAANRAKSAFLSTISHELRTPLTAVIGYSELVLREMQMRGVQDYTSDLTYIHTAGHQLLTIINAILDLTRLEANNVMLNLETFAVAELVDDVLEAARPLARKNSNALVVDCASDVGALCSDRARVRQVLLHILDNAAKFTDHGAITLAVARLPIDGQAWLRFAVTDTGIGIPADQTAAIFQEFTQITSQTQLFGGTGLGLSISRRFCELLGGSIAVVSELGSGSTFTVLLPAETATDG